jgi:GH25 family lysozyme M1 (1,4-beta-N-acetylmuramidase)
MFDKKIKAEDSMKHNLQMKLTKLKSLIMALAIILPLAVPSVTVQAASPNEVAQAAIGIDVSRFNGIINWDQVAASGVKFAMIRVGSRTSTTGIMTEDVYARYNLQEANRVGIKVGVYFFSTAVSEAEVLEEANFTIGLISKYKITFPVAYDCEKYNSTSSRQYALGRDVRTALAIKFLDTIAAAGYTPMFYASQSAMTANADWNMTLLNKYKVWVAQYPSQPFPLTPATTYTGIYSMWQYTCKGAIAGISGSVDMSVSYFDYDGIADAKDPTGAAQVLAAAAALVQYTAVTDVVTPNTTSVNVRTVASLDSSSTIVAIINPGDMLYRTGVGNNGWSQVIINNQIYYVYSAYLTKVL